MPLVTLVHLAGQHPPRDRARPRERHVSRALPIVWRGVRDARKLARLTRCRASSAGRAGSAEAHSLYKWRARSTDVRAAITWAMKASESPRVQR